ncbi:hypothetical protein LMG27952_04316 [Paraburkholderia hiiakae]|uniref:Uncharacterized protein n=1 Tax=Paraburkholderia hiiakae TaxID=1081782 RepID=A0ABM8NVG5_9BURK|nr:hypothetical protein [Paraburkholderia hiiakae]CAD6545483.1 hypothetical protein LMG27952_04316 [Paraburkholderia hiiakae]
MKHHESADDDGTNVKHPQHESSEPLARRHPHEPRSVGRQGHSDVESGQEDTDRRGADAHQQRTKNDAQVNRNSREGRR